MDTKLLEKAEKMMGSQFNEEAWKNLIKTNPKRAEEMLNKIQRKLK